MITLEKYLRNAWVLMVIWILSGRFLPGGENSIMYRAGLTLVGILVLSGVFLHFVMDIRFHMPVLGVSVKIGRLDPGSLLYRSGLRDGDVITEIDGERLNYASDVQYWWCGKESACLTVLREGKEIQVTVVKK